MKKYGMGGMMRRPEREKLMPRERRGMPGMKPVPEEPMYKKGGDVKDSKKMAKKEIAFMKKKGAPKSMIKHEKAEYGMKKGVKKMAVGGSASAPREDFGRPIMVKPPKFQGEGPVHERVAKRNFANGGSVFRKAADGVATKGKTKGKMVKMRYGGEC